MSRNEDNGSGITRMIAGAHGRPTCLERLGGWFVGLDFELLSELPRWDRNYVISLAASLFIPAVLGGLGMYFAIGSFVDDSPWIAWGAALWGAIVLFIDRQLLVASLRGSGPLGLVVRMAMAVLASLVISTTLEIKLFEPYLQDRRADQQAQQLDEEARSSRAAHEQSVKSDPVTDDLKSREAALVAELAALRAAEQHLVERQNELERDVSAEARIQYCGVKCAELKRIAREHEVNSLTPQRDKITAREQELQGVRDSLSQRVAAVTKESLSTVTERERRLMERQARRSRDIISQIDELHALARENGAIMVTMLLIQLLLLIVEMMPLLAKLITKSAVEVRVREQLELCQYREVERAAVGREALDRGRRSSVDVEAGMAELDHLLREINVSMSNPLWHSGGLDAEEIENMQAQMKKYLKKKRGVVLRDDPYRD